MWDVTLRKRKLDADPINDISLSSDSLDLIEKYKPPFENTDEYINRLINLQNEYIKQKGNDFIDLTFHKRFLHCSHEYLQKYYSSNKKKKVKDDTREKIKNSISELFKSDEDNILLLLLLIDESITLLFQTDFFNAISNFNETKFESETIDQEFVKIIE